MNYMFIPFRFMETVTNLPIQAESDAPLMFIDCKSDDHKVYDIMLFAFIGGATWYTNEAMRHLEIYETFKGMWLYSIFRSNRLSSSQKYHFVNRMIPPSKLRAFLAWKHSYNYDVEFFQP